MPNVVSLKPHAIRRAESLSPARASSTGSSVTDDGSVVDSPEVVVTGSGAIGPASRVSGTAVFGPACGGSFPGADTSDWIVSQL